MSWHWPRRILYITSMQCLISYDPPNPLLYPNTLEELVDVEYCGATLSGRIQTCHLGLELLLQTQVSL
jgi:hypothetical protein